MNKSYLVGFVAILLLSSVGLAWSPFDEGWQRQHKNADNLKAYDKYCPSVEVHPGYFVKQVMVRLSKLGGSFECQFPSSNEASVSTHSVVAIEAPVETCTNMTRSNVCVEKTYNNVTSAWVCTERRDYHQEACGSDSYSFICTAYKTVAPGLRQRECGYELN